jgi:L-threonylcarbamoyladenylate synthase
MHEDLKNALKILREGGVILYPTDTIWGLGCDATNEEAINRIYCIKQRHDEKSLIILLDSAESLHEYLDQVPEMAMTLIEITSKPLTIIYPGARNLAQNLVANDGSIAIRIVNDDFCRNLVRQLGKPIVSTSANISGKPWPPYYAKIDKAIIRSVDYVVKWRQLELTRGTPSGIIKLGLNGEVQVIRE